MVDPHYDPPTLSPLSVYARRPYEKHHLHPEVYEPIFDRFQHLDISEPFADIAWITKVRLKTIYRWHSEFRRNPDWRLDRRREIINRRVFTNAQEKAMTRYITDHFLQCHVPVTLEILRTLIMAQHRLFLQSAGGDERSVSTRPRPNFRVTRHFITNIMKRNCLSYRCTRAARWPVIDPEEVERYRAEFEEAYATVPWDRTLNADESFSLIFYLPRKMIAATGVETVKVEVDGERKAWLTLMGTITAAGTKLRPFLVAKDSLAVVTNNSVTSLIRLMFTSPTPRVARSLNQFSVDIWHIFGNKCPMDLCVSLLAITRRT
jgi:hypothetical protein